MNRTELLEAISEWCDADLDGIYDNVLVDRARILLEAAAEQLSDDTPDRLRLEAALRILMERDADTNALISLRREVGQALDLLNPAVAHLTESIKKET